MSFFVLYVFFFFLISRNNATNISILKCNEIFPSAYFFFPRALSKQLFHLFSKQNNTPVALRLYCVISFQCVCTGGFAGLSKHGTQKWVKWILGKNIAFQVNFICFFLFRFWRDLYYNVENLFLLEVRFFLSNFNPILIKCVQNSGEMTTKGQCQIVNKQYILLMHCVFKLKNEYFWN